MQDNFTNARGQCAKCGKWLSPSFVITADSERICNECAGEHSASCLRGWECPKCGAVYSPDTRECWHCAPALRIT